MEAMNTASGSPKRNKKIGKARAETIDPKDTNLDMVTIRMKTSKVNREGRGEMAMNTPNAVATPFPPRKLRKAENWWPRTAMSETAASSN